jgi:fructose-bisphosphate aldolase/2-amino-3,7-dideoxy-D-threo-hept-6-ulosonate synthase
VNAILSDAHLSTSLVQPGLVRRVRRLFRHADGRAIMVPMDHGLYSGPLRGLENPLHIARQVMPGADGVLISPGFARTIAAELPSSCALALRAGVLSDLSPMRDHEAVYLGIERVLRYAADWLVHTLYLGGERDAEAICDAGVLIEAADRYELPVMLEFLPRDDGWKPDQVAVWARLGAELGASAIKTIYTGDPDSFARVTAGCPVPVLIAGGPTVGTLADLLHTVAEAVEAGGAGLAIGRRVWQHDDPACLLGWLGDVVHGRTTVEMLGL